MNLQGQNDRKEPPESVARMLKLNRKISKGNFSPNDIQKYRSELSAIDILKTLKGLTVDDVLTELFITTDYPEAKQLMNNYEKMLVLGCVDEDRFMKEFHRLLQESHFYIKENNLHLEFFEFFYFTLETLSKRETTYKAYISYLNLLTQQIAYFCKTDQIVCGVNTTGELIIENDPMPYSDLPFYLVDLKSNNAKNDFARELRRLGYDFEITKENIERFHEGARMSNTNAIHMAPFINENLLHMWEGKTYLPVNGMKILRQWKETSFYKDCLSERRYQLPPEGVMGTYRNAQNIYRIFFCETYQYGRIILLFKIFNEADEGFCGYYDTKSGHFYTFFKDTTVEGTVHAFLENFVLENYCHLTTDMEIDRNRLKALVITDNLDAPTDYYQDERVKVRFEYKKRSKTHDAEPEFRYFDKSNYQEIEVNVNPFIRKLPVGAVASDEARVFARELGYVLKAGETFVRPHSRRTYQVSDGL